MSVPTGQELYDAVIVGLASRRAKNPNELTYRGVSILRSLCASRKISTTVFAAKNNQQLVGITMKNLQYIGIDRSINPLQRLIRTSEKHLLVHVRQELFEARCLYTVGEGYELTITANGIAYAQSVLSSS